MGAAHDDLTALPGPTCGHQRRDESTLRCADCGEVIPIPGLDGFDAFVLFVNLPQPLEQQLKERALRDGLTLAGVTRKALQLYLKPRRS
jgi:hypothetical protein